SSLSLLCASLLSASAPPRDLHSFPTRRSSDLRPWGRMLSIFRLRPPDGERYSLPAGRRKSTPSHQSSILISPRTPWVDYLRPARSEEHTSELQSRFDLVCRLLLEKKKKIVVITSIFPFNANYTIIITTDI